MLFCTFLCPFLHDYDVNWCLISRFMEDVNKQRRNFISITVLGYGAYRNSTPGGLAYTFSLPSCRWISKSLMCLGYIVMVVRPS